MAVAVDLGSSTVGVWATHRGVVSGDASASGALVRRGRVVDVEGCATLLGQLVQRYAQPVPSSDVVVACRPVLATEAEQLSMRRVIEAALAPRRMLFIDTVRAAAIGSGAAAGSLLIADIGAQLTEIALLENGRVTAARRAEMGTRDLGRGATVGLLTDIVARHVADLRATGPADDMDQAVARGLLLAGDGALHPALPAALAAALRLRVHQAAAPRTAALHGAGLAAMSALRHPVVS
ncbi:hypothetical protein Ait01nite_015960 [Actinoplanes italicus]|uniref:Rod shape-determining protein MreB n=1 Tax=Actinoplanes italicus TaxID=113567 RepID=A0A2T0KHX2_9ACTN|nr:rod shape-determining protein [Actinoplanes italicus]PRX23032.1 rod shape-determining protein MreB [Actinoplanes italicus]GIE28551.1 hypothetical protein Ait01nite_015960 [Actinoplanes italicus]